MTDSRTARSPVGDGTVASMTGFDGTVIATVSQTLEYTDARAVVAVVAVDGDVDRDTAPLVERILIRAIDEHPHTRLDVRQVGFFGAAGLHLLIRAHEHAGTLGHTFTLRGVHGITERVMTIAGLHHTIPAGR